MDYRYFFISHVSNENIPIELIYPSESGLYPTHLLLGLVTTAIFIIILFGKNQFDKYASTIKNYQFRLDYMAVAGGLLALVAFIGTPYSQQSLLDYHVNLPNDTSVSVDVLNSGIKEANNVLISFNSKNIQFSNFTTLPHLPIKSIKANTIVQSGNANFTLESLPTRSFTTVYAKTNNLQNAENLKVFVRAEDSVAYFNLGLIISYYLSLGAVYAIAACFFWVYSSKDHRIITVTLSIVALYALHLFIPWLHDCGFTYTGCY